MLLPVARAADLTDSDRSRLFDRQASFDSIIPMVQRIMDDVRARGDESLRELTKQFDGVCLEDLEVSQQQLEASGESVPPPVRRALENEVAAVTAFHRAQLPHTQSLQTAPGVEVWREWRAISAVGLYVPGGRGAYPSSVLMLAIPARLAGCREVILCTPPGRDGQVPDVTLFAAALAGVTRVFAVGGAQAIAAMAYGTGSVPQVDKIFGAGNAYVTVAKLLAFPRVALDAPAGPSELLILADASADPRWIAADMLSDAEHGPDSPAVLITTSMALAERVQAELALQLDSLPRKAIAEEALRTHGMIVVAETLDEMILLANEYAAEHLEILTSHPKRVLAGVVNAGSIFLGPYSPNAAGDYATGTNHVLPTARFARMFPPVSLESFGRMVQCQELTRDGLLGLSPTIATLARGEDLEGHARAVEARIAGHDDA